MGTYYRIDRYAINPYNERLHHDGKNQHDEVLTATQKISNVLIVIRNNHFGPPITF
jgi:hypothetical protein